MKAETGPLNFDRETGRVTGFTVKLEINIDEAQELERLHARSHLMIAVGVLPEDGITRLVKCVVDQMHEQTKEINRITYMMEHGKPPEDDKEG